MKRSAMQLFLAALVSACMVSFSFAAQDPGADTAAPVKSAEKKQKKKTFPDQENLIDINTATADQLKALPGLTNEDVNKIIAGRPYARKNQLKQKKIISAEQYNGIKSQIVARKPAKPTP